MRKLIKNKNKKGFAMAELLAVSIVLLFIFSILFSNYLPLVAEYETRLSYNDVTAQYAAHYVRKMYKEALDSTDIVEDKTWGESIKEAIKTGIGNQGYFPVYKVGKINIISDHVLDKENCERIIEQYGIEEIIITNYKLKDDNDNTTKYVKNNYEQKDGSLYDYIGYLPNYEKSIYTGKTQNGEEEQLYRLILKTKDYGYATTPILSDYKTPGSCFEGVSNGDGETLTITKYHYNENNGCGKEVIIKNNYVKLKNGVRGKITKIGKETFKDMPIEKVTLSDVDYIGDSAFENTGLSSMPMPSLNKITFIGSRAFAKTKIKDVDLSGDRTIGDYAFADNLYLRTVILPEASIYSKDDSGNLILAKGLFARSGTSTIGIDVSIPSGMKYVGEEMFYLAKISSIKLNDGVKTIGTKAFSQKKADGKPTNYNVGTVNIPASVKELQNESFEMLGITSLTFDFGNDDLKILGGAFKGNQISTVTIPSRVSEIGNSAFEASGIQNLIFEKNDKINTIAKKTFYKNNIKSVIVPNSITAIGESAFEQNPDLSDLTLSSNLLTIGVRSFYNTGLTNVTIPGTVIKILSSAFQNSKLTEVEFSDGSDYLDIKNSVFQDTSLNTFTIPERVKSIGSNIFSGFGTNAKIYNKSKYLNDTNWCDKFSASNATCKIEGPDNENKLTITYTIESTYNTRYVYNMGGATNE